MVWSIGRSFAGRGGLVCRAVVLPLMDRNGSVLRTWWSSG